MFAWRRKIERAIQARAGRWAQGNIERFGLSGFRMLGLRAQWAPLTP